MVKKVGKYVLGNTLGEGAFSKVKKAVHMQTKEVVAIKIINSKKTDTKEKEEWIRREVAVLRKLDHPSIIKLHEVLMVGEKMHIVLEYVNGGELLEHVATVGKLSEAEGRTFFHQLFAAVVYMHSMGVVHRDLKPENLLLTTKKQLKVADFGLANIVTTQRDGCFQLMTTIVGSPDYCAPEVVQEKDYDGFKADIYSCGTILFTMVTGGRPFEAKDSEATIQKVKEGLFIVPRYLSKECDDFIHDLMHMEPDRRPSLGKIAEHRWFVPGWCDSGTAEILKASCGGAGPSANGAKIREAVTSAEVASAIQKVALEKATGNVFSLIAGLQSGDVDALVGKAGDAKFLLTVPDMQAAFARVLGLLRSMQCRVQKRSISDSQNKAGYLLLFSYVNLATGVLTFTTELQARPPGLIALTLRLERGDRASFEDITRVISAHLADLFENSEWATVAGRQLLDESMLLSPLKEGLGSFSSDPRSPGTTPVNPDAGAISPDATKFAVELPLAPEAGATRLYNMLLDLHASPVLLHSAKQHLTRVVGFIASLQQPLLTYTAHMAKGSDASSTVATFVLTQGPQVVFEEFQRAVQSMSST
ncbi:CBL-interacting protein kinase 21 [Diplonema papillatum]|nr:CBL-interacting protein kinase 21 [Diplonema papillatum]